MVPLPDDHTHPPVGRSGTEGLADLIQESLVLRDLEGRVVSWNASSAVLYGWQRRDAVGQKLHSLLHSTHEQPVDTLEKELLATGTWEGDLKRLTASGVEVDVHVRWTLRRDRAGSPIDIVETAHDITAMRRLKVETERAESRYQALFQAMAASFWRLDFSGVGAMLRQLRTDGVSDYARHLNENPRLVRDMMAATRILEVNDHTVQLFGLGDRNAFNGSVEPFWPEESTHVFLAATLAAVRRIENYSTETKLRRIDGSEFDGLFSVCFPTGGQTAELLIGVIDITERQRALTELRVSEARYRNMFHSVSVAFWELDFRPLAARLRELAAAGVTDMVAYARANPDIVDELLNITVATDVNEAARILFGAETREELLGPITRFWPEQSRRIYLESLNAALRSNANFEAEVKMLTQDGREIDVIVTTSVPPGDEFRIVLLGMLDITDRVNSREALARMQTELAHAARVSLLGELTASIAHEVNQPLAAISANGNAGLRWLSRDKPAIEEAKALTGRIVSDARRAADIIARVRDMAAGREPTRSRVLVNDVVEESVAFLRHDLDTNRIDLSLELDTQIPHVSADRTQLQQVLVNLIVNAMQAMSESPRRSLTIQTTQTDSATIAIAITDTGPGIAPENLPRLFGSFFATKATGMGLGLPICRSIVEAHGGRIAVSNISPAGGACFELTLPAADRLDA